MQSIVVNSTYTGFFGDIIVIEPTTITALDDATGSVLNNFITNPFLQLPIGAIISNDMNNPTNYFTNITVTGTVLINIY